MADNEKDSRLADIQKRAALASKNRVGVAQFMEEAWGELKKTSWPTYPILVKSISVVLALVVAVAVWVGLIDIAAGKIMGSLFKSN